MRAREPQNRAIILIPMFNDWDSAELLMAELDRALAGYAMSPEIVLVDDGSTQPMPPGFAGRSFTTLGSVDILRLRRNIGHQRAIATGLVYIYENRPCRAVVVMDADGQDRPVDILPLTAQFEREGQRLVVFAARAKRLESPWFRVLYHAYRLMHRLATGEPVRVGNFSIIPFHLLEKLVVMPEIWNHYAAAVIRTRIGSTSIPISRGKRLTGESRMNFTALFLHGLRAFFVYGEILGARLLVAIAVMLILGTVVVGGALALNLSASLGLAGRFLYIAGVLGVILLEAFLSALILVFTVIASNGNMGFLPLRDCRYFVGGIERVFPAVDPRLAPEDIAWSRIDR